MCRPPLQPRDEAGTSDKRPGGELGQGDRRGHGHGDDERQSVTSEAAVSGYGGSGGRFDLRAKIGLGVVILGCAAALAFGGLPYNEMARSQPQPAGQAAAGAGYGTDQVAWLEQFQLAGSAPHRGLWCRPGGVARAVPDRRGGR